MSQKQLLYLKHCFWNLRWGQKRLKHVACLQTVYMLLMLLAQLGRSNVPYFFSFAIVWWQDPENPIQQMLTSPAKCPRQRRACKVGICEIFWTVLTWPPATASPSATCKWKCFGQWSKPGHMDCPNDNLRKTWLCACKTCRFLQVCHEIFQSPGSNFDWVRFDSLHWVIFQQNVSLIWFAGNKCSSRCRPAFNQGIPFGWFGLLYMPCNPKRIAQNTSLFENALDETVEEQNFLPNTVIVYGNSCEQMRNNNQRHLLHLFWANRNRLHRRCDPAPRYNSTNFFSNTCLKIHFPGGHFHKAPLIGGTFEDNVWHVKRENPDQISGNSALPYFFFIVFVGANWSTWPRGHLWYSLVKWLNRFWTGFGRWIFTFVPAKICGEPLKWGFDIWVPSAYRKTLCDIAGYNR